MGALTGMLRKTWSAIVAGLPIAKSPPIGSQNGSTLLQQDAWVDPVTGYSALVPSGIYSPVVFAMGLDSNQDAPYTAEPFSVIMNATSNVTTAFPYAMYVELTTAHQNTDAVGVNATMFHSGSAWATAMHAEPHMEAGNSGTTIGVNVEANKDPMATGRCLGINVNGTEGTIDQGVNIQGVYQTALNFDVTSGGTRGIWMQGQYGLGLDLGNNDVAMTAGHKVFLEETQQVYITFNPNTNKVEIHKEGAVVASW